MSAQQLADRCAELGMPSLNRAVIAKLENGHREAIGTAELLVIANALEIAPTLLLLPLGQEPVTDIAPDRSMPTWEAVRWFYGVPRSYIANSLESANPIWDSCEPVAMFELHDYHVNLYDYVLKSGEALSENFSFEEQLAAHLAGIREQRSKIRNRGMIPPELPAHISHLDKDASPWSYAEMLASAMRAHGSRENTRQEQAS
ncbi:MAG TPA: hypothetical protein VN969_47620 [Streptosporangiaceae bacterium]|nr:hypothetical protein [Streptosporangiaceae bacterium]